MSRELEVTSAPLAITVARRLAVAQPSDRSLQLVVVVVEAGTTAQVLLVVLAVVVEPRTMRVQPQVRHKETTAELEAA